jgi:hypothetical protein
MCRSAAIAGIEFAVSDRNCLMMRKNLRDHGNPLSFAQLQGVHGEKPHGWFATVLERP